MKASLMEGMGQILTWREGDPMVTGRRVPHGLLKEALTALPADQKAHCESLSSSAQSQLCRLLLAWHVCLEVLVHRECRAILLPFG